MGNHHQHLITLITQTPTANSRRRADLLYGLVSSKILLKGPGSLTVSQHDVVGNRCPSSAFGLDVGPILCGQVKSHNQVALRNVHAFLHDAGGDQQVGFMSPKFAQNL